MKYLDYTGLTYLWNRLKSYFMSKSDFEEAEQVVAASLNDLNSKKQSTLSSDNKLNADFIADGTNNKVFTTADKTKLDSALTSYTETDPTVPAWAKAVTKPTYTLDEVADGSTRKLSTLAPKASPTFTGTPNAPTAAAGTNTTQIATTAFVKTALDNRISSVTGGPGGYYQFTIEDKNFAFYYPSGTSDILLLSNLSDVAPKTSPAFTGTPTAPTAAAGTNTTQIATTAFVNTAVASYLPLAGGTMDNGASITLGFGATGKHRTLKLTGNAITYDATEDLTGGIAGSFLTAKFKGSDGEVHNTTVIGVYGSTDGYTNGLSYIYFASPGSNYSDPQIKVTVDGNIISTKNITAASFIKSGGTSSQFLKADGSVDSNTYVPYSMLNICAYGTSSTAAATAQKVVTISSIESLNSGQIIVVIPTITSTVANSTIKLNDFDAYPMRYNHAAITTSTDSIVWSANIPSIFMFDGTYWQFLGHGLDSNTTYSALTQAQLDTGTATTSRLITAKLLRDNFYTKDEIDDSSWYGTESQFNALSSLEEGVNYYIYDS